jgi:hypothetical protein
MSLCNSQHAQVVWVELDGLGNIVSIAKREYMNTYIGCISSGVVTQSRGSWINEWCRGVLGYQMVSYAGPTSLCLVNQHILGMHSASWANAPTWPCVWSTSPCHVYQLVWCVALASMVNGWTWFGKVSTSSWRDLQSWPLVAMDCNE